MKVAQQLAAAACTRRFAPSGDFMATLNAMFPVPKSTSERPSVQRLWVFAKPGRPSRTSSATASEAIVQARPLAVVPGSTGRKASIAAPSALSAQALLMARLTALGLLDGEGTNIFLVLNNVVS